METGLSYRYRATDQRMDGQPQPLLTRGERGRLRVLAAFSIMGLALLFAPSPSWQTGIGDLIICCSALAQLLLRLRRRRVERDSASVSGVSVPGGVPVRERRSRYIALGVSLIVIGVVFAWAFRAGGRMPLTLGELIAASGVLCVALAPLVGRRALQFDPEGLLVLERAFRFRVPWNEITAVRTSEWYGHSFVAVMVRDSSALVAVAHAQTARRGDAASQLRRYLARQRAATGADLWIDAGLFGLDAVLLVRAIARYVSSPSARTELVARHGAERSV